MSNRAELGWKRTAGVIALEGKTGRHVDDRSGITCRADIRGHKTSA